MRSSRVGYRSTASITLLLALAFLPRCESNNSFDDLFAPVGSVGGRSGSEIAGSGSGSGSANVAGALVAAGDGGLDGDPENSSAGEGGDEPSIGGAGSGNSGGEAVAGAPVAGRGWGGRSGRGGAPSLGGRSNGDGGSSAGAGSGGTEPMPPPGADFILGADISSLPEQLDEGAVYLDTDGQEKPFLELLSGHGFNYVRLRTFVEPANLYGYANPNGEWQRSEPYCDLSHTVEFAKTVKDAGLKLLVNLHYSDNWADPGKQIIPESWRGVSSIEELGEHVRDYTREVVQTLTDAGARPDMIQIGNEITPGMLIHVPTETQSEVDNWGNVETVVNSVNGRSSNAPNLALLLKKGIEGVRDADPDKEIAIMLHIIGADDVNGAKWWIDNVREQGVEFDVLGLSCYTAWHGSPTTWRQTFQALAAAYPELSFVVAEYNPEARFVNELMRDLPDRRGLGSFLWEPTLGGTWGNPLFNPTQTANTYSADVERFSEYDAIRSDFRLDDAEPDPEMDPAP